MALKPDGTTLEHDGNTFKHDSTTLKHDNAVPEQDGIKLEGDGKTSGYDGLAFELILKSQVKEGHQTQCHTIMLNVLRDQEYEEKYGKFYPLKMKSGPEKCKTFE